MANDGIKTDCKVCPAVDGKIVIEYDGYIHLLTAPYDEHFSAEYGAFTVICTSDENHRLVVEKEVYLLMGEQTRRVHILGGHFHRATVIGDAVVPDENFTHYIVATSG